uniref:Uncharacterized protein n=2 Tax=Panagrolaimus superbus TaxID=310955 RepID=A0A914YVG7_9BILA
MNDTVLNATSDLNIDETFLNATSYLNDTLIPLADEILTHDDENRSIWLYGIAFGFILACAFILIFCRICARKSKKSRNISSQNNIELGHPLVARDNASKLTSSSATRAQNHRVVAASEPESVGLTSREARTRSMVVVPETFITPVSESMDVTPAPESLVATIQKESVHLTTREARTRSMVGALETNSTSITPARELLDVTTHIESIRLTTRETKSTIFVPVQILLLFTIAEPGTNSAYLIPNDPESLYVTAELESILLTPESKFVSPKTNSTRPTPAPNSPFTPSKSRYGRNRIAPVKTYMGEKPIYKYDEDGLPTLVDVHLVEPESPEPKTPAPRTSKSKTPSKSRDASPNRRRTPRKSKKSVDNEDE